MFFRIIRLYKGNMTSVLIYPFGKESEIIAKHSEQLVDLRPCCFVGFKGWEHSYSNIRNSFEVVFDFEKALNDFEPEVVWFVKFSDGLDFKTYYLPYINVVIEKNLPMIIDRDLMRFLDDSIIDKIVFYNLKTDIKIEGDSQGETLYPINKPIIYISSFYGELKKTDLLLSIRNKLNEYDISATYIGANSMLNYFGVYNFPYKILKNDVSDQSKVIMVNTCLKEIEEKENSDLIVVSVPGEMFCVSKKYLANMGFLPYDCFLAAKPDILITTLPYSIYSEKELSIIKKMIYQRFGVEVDVLCRVNKRLLLHDTETDQQYSYLTISKEDIVETQDKGSYYDFNQDNISFIVDECLEKLYKYGEIDLL